MSNDRYLSPIILQGLGAVLIIAAFVFWAVTDRESAVLIGAAISLTGVGAAQGLRLRARDAAAAADKADEQ